MQSHVRRITTAVGAAALAFTWGCSTGSEQSERGTDLQSERTAEPSPEERAGSHDWRTVTTEYYRLHSASGFEDDAKKAQGYLNAAVKGLLDEFGPTPLQSLLRDASVDIYLHPRPTPKASESTATIVSGVQNDRYFAKVHILTLSAYGSGSRTIVGEPRDDSYFFKTLVHEYSTVALERLRRSNPGWSFFSAPHWFYQGYEEYLALTRSSEKARTVTLQKYKQKLKRDPTRVRLGLQVSNEYIDGALILLFMHQVFGRGRVQALLSSDRASFWDAVHEEIGLSVEELFAQWNEWRKKL